MPRVLLVGGDADATRHLRAHLAVEGHEIAEAATAAAALECVRAEAAAGAALHLAVVTLALPDRHGYELLRDLRREAPDLALVALTACPDEAHRVRGLRLGADDVLVEPFGVTEFVARVEAVLRRTLPRSSPNAAPNAASDASPGAAATPARPALRFGDVEVDPEARVVRRRGVEVPLGPKEFDLLAALLRRAGAIAPRAVLLREVWGYDRSVTSRTVDGHVAALRRKLEEDPRAPRYLLTAVKAGYRLRI